MDDLVKRLNKESGIAGIDWSEWSADDKAEWALEIMCAEAAAEIERLTKHMDWLQRNHAKDMDEMSRLTAERDTFYMDYRMKADAITKALHIERGGMLALIDDLRKEVEALRADAGRYRWLRLNSNDERVYDDTFSDVLSAERLDAAIDAAMKAYHAGCHGKGAA